MWDRISEQAKALYRRFCEVRELSWWGHGLQGFAIAFGAGFLTVRLARANGLEIDGSRRMGVWTGWLTATVTFAHRELSDALDVWRDEDLGAAWDMALEDGWGDFWSPYIGAVLGALAALLIDWIVGP